MLSIKKRVDKKAYMVYNEEEYMRCLVEYIYQWYKRYLVKNMKDFVF